MALCPIAAWIDRRTVTANSVEQSIVRCPDENASAKMIELIEKTRAEGDSLGARTTIAAPPRTMDATALVADIASYCVSWPLDDRQRELLLRLTPSAFGDQRSDWAISLTDAYWVGRQFQEAREYAEQAQRAYLENIRKSPGKAMLHVERAYALAILRRKEEATSEGTRALDLARDFTTRARVLRWLSRTFVLLGDEERASLETRLARLLRRPGHEIQRTVGTREPTPEQLEVGRAALDEILRVETAESA